MKDGDYIEHLFVTSSHDYLLFFSNRGKVYRSKVYELPEASRTAKGRALVNVLPLREGERIQSVLSTRDFTEGKYLIFGDAARRGEEDGVHRSTTRRSRPTASSPSTSATTTSSSPCGGRAATTTSSWSPRKGQAVRFHEDGARAMGRDTSGVRGMDVSGPDDAVLAMDVARDDDELLVVTENGYGKRTGDRPVPQDEPRRQGRRDDQAHRGEGRPRRRARRARAPGARLHLARGHGAAHRRPRHQPLRPPLAGRAGHEHPRRRRRQRGRAGHGVRARGRGRRRRGLRPRGRRVARPPTSNGGGATDADATPPTSPTSPDGRRVSEAAPRQVEAPIDGRDRRGLSLLWRDQRKEVVRIDSSSSCGTLEVTGR